MSSSVGAESTPLSSSQSLYALKIDALPVDRPWGGQQLSRRFGKTPVGESRIGETWETGLEAVVANGVLAGHTLANVARAWGTRLVGLRAPVSSEAPFPLLVKFIDAAENLSIQVHPGDPDSPERGSGHGKTEAWYILDAAPGATLYHGWRRPLRADDAKEAIQQGCIDAVVRSIPARPGEAIFTPAGTIHAIGSGILLYEVQQYSDLTYRLHDWNRVAANGAPRELHLEQGLAALDYSAASVRSVAGLEVGPGRAIVAACKYFALERWSLVDEQRVALGGTTCHIVTVVAGAASLVAGEAEPVTLRSGHTAIVPAAITEYAIEPVGSAVVLVTYVPELMSDVVARLRARGHPDGAIAELGGGATARNDLRPFLS